MKGLRSIVRLSTTAMRGVTPNKVVGKKPVIEWVKPTEIFVEESYQRTMEAEASTSLVRKIVGGFIWSRFKIPVCVRASAEMGGVLVCIDGQHTATGAATHPDVEKIPVMIVDAASVSDRADSFVGHNRDRIALTNLAIHRAEVAAGHELPVMMDRACRAAGAHILERHTSMRNNLPVGATTAVGAIRTVARERGEEFLTKVMRTLVKAGRGPILGDEITASAALLKTGMPEDRLAEMIKSKGAQAWRALAVIRIGESGEKPPAALASVWRLQLREGVPRAVSSETPQPPSYVKPITPKPVLRQPVPAPVVEAEPEKRGIRKTGFDAGRAAGGDLLTAKAIDRGASRDLLAEAWANTAKLQAKLPPEPDE